ncbi:bifunctional glycosyltransferase family 2/GtrA family protein [Butyrivibrio sp. VCD2006]|uniref:bifunctional glycosyltransferase family 2/GtrA family protein n=1 Tax=Butyrivibrio sp. VCD2006 TaxID=1280664 RepID=UPI00042003C4|nr:bifunctional glycosyltransferase family 2/GtrA family protein [Butyrivibrio sp. VCD2006]
MIFNDIPVIIPAYKPNDNLINLVSDLSENGFSKIIIVDDGNGPQMAGFFEHIEQKFNATILHHSVNLGYGRSLKTAFNHALLNCDDLKGCIISDCNGIYKISDICKCARLLADNPESLILTNRDKSQSEIKLSNKITNTIFTYSYRFLFGLTVNDSQSILKGIPAKYMKKLLKVIGEGYSFDTNIIVYTKNYHIDVIETDLETSFSSRKKTEKYRTLRESFFIYVNFATYMLISIWATLVDIILFTLLCTVLGRFSLLGRHQIYIYISTIIARIISATMSYNFNYRFVFKKKHGKKETFKRFVIVAGCQMLISAILVSTIHRYVGGEEVLIKIPTDFVLFFVAYQFNRRFVFKR